MPRIPTLLALLAVLAPCASFAEDDVLEAHFQSTYVWQVKPAFPAAYTGPHSLLPEHEKSYSFSATGSLGLRAWENGELYIDPEVTQGVALSGLAGLGGFTNGEITRTAGSNPTFYLARFFVRHTWNQGEASEAVEADFDQLSGRRSPRRCVLSAGMMSIADLFDDNAYAHDARTQFLNLSFVSNGAYDFAANTHGYTAGAAIECFRGPWGARFGRFAQPKEPNQHPLDMHLLEHFGDQVEVEHAHEVAGRPGKVRVLAFRNRARMSRFQEAIDAAAASGGVPDLNAVRNSDQVKVGIGVSAEQELAKGVGLFARGMWADGKTETYAFTEIDRSLSGGVLLQGARWARPDDTLGFALARNYLSPEHRRYLELGGLGFFLGDGALNYRPEAIVEVFYSVALHRLFHLSFDWQHIDNPGYNADRGPVNTWAIRGHVEF